MWAVNIIVWIALKVIQSADTTHALNLGANVWESRILKGQHFTHLHFKSTLNNSIGLTFLDTSYLDFVKE